MATGEYGTVARTTVTKQRSCGRFGCTDYEDLVVLVKMPNGSTRACIANNLTSNVAKDMFIVGSKVNLDQMERVY